MGREGAIDSHYFVPISCIDANLRTWGPATALTVRKKPLEGNTKTLTHLSLKLDLIVETIPVTVDVKFLDMYSDRSDLAYLRAR
jgi:hypothetical protein